MEKVKMEVGSGSGSGSSLSQRSRRFSCLRLCHCGLPAKIRQAWTDKNPGRHFYGCPRFKLGNECKYFSWFDEEDGTEWQRRALLQARDEIREKNKVIEQLQKTISEMKSHLEKKKTGKGGNDENEEDDIVRKFEELYA
ncbi:unnamed protein product [Eruca vesicaria subsp. sativa]|uniref:GRF-type domain-containing protein n=1 Tax=Eruca vesicaria subsp. sativa TaxID=29727 RepID=A0ABC8KLS4_ERUVS|nr:unnamed protein product [Eruca vesicaria subsp. sativa]